MKVDWDLIWFKEKHGFFHEVAVKEPILLEIFMICYDHVLFYTYAGAYAFEILKMVMENEGS